MAATIGGAFKAMIEHERLGVAVYRDGPPMATTSGEVAVPYPHVVVQEGIGGDVELHGDFGDDTAHDGMSEDVQIDLYDLAREQITATRTRSVERYDLPRKLTRLLRGNKLAPHAPMRVYGHNPVGYQRWPISDNIVRHTWTVRVRRDADEQERDDEPA